MPGTVLHNHAIVLHRLIMLMARRQLPFDGLIAASLAKACRRETAASLEEPCQVLLTGEAACERDFGNALVAFAQEPFSAINPHLYQVLVGSLAQRGAEPSREMAGADTRGFCDRRQVERPSEVRLHEVDRPADLATPLLTRRST